MTAVEQEFSFVPAAKRRGSTDRTHRLATEAVNRTYTRYLEFDRLRMSVQRLSVGLSRRWAHSATSRQITLISSAQVRERWQIGRE